MQELFRVPGYAVGIYDDKNFYVAQHSLGGKGAKDEGQDRFASLKYYQTLPEACRRLIERMPRTKDARTVGEYITELQRATTSVCDKLDAVLKKHGLPTLSREPEADSPEPTDKPVKRRTRK